MYKLYKWRWKYAIVATIICRFLAFIAILAFVFGIVYITSNIKCLSLLFLLLTVKLIPVYDFKIAESTKTNIDEDN